MNGAWIITIAAIAAGLLLSVPVERMAVPTPRLSGRPAAAWCIHFGSALLCFTIILAVSRRPCFAAALSLALWVLLVIVNNAKFRTLREPFVFSDFALFSQALRFPRLYLPFLGLRHTAAGGLLSVSAGYLGIQIEPTVVPRIGLEPFVATIGLALLTAAVLLATGLRNSAPPLLDPDADLRRLGLWASLWLYRLAEAGPLPEPPACANNAVAGNPRECGRNRSDDMPHLIVVQNESFFDARRLWTGVDPGLLRSFDRARRCGLYGRLAVPAWGANTMRTEFAFLTGIPARELGVHRFNPFRRYARRPLPGIAHDLRGLGYRTICIHPHPIGFFGRDRVYPYLGFDRFIDIGEFRGAERFGPYISDAAVTEKIAGVLAEDRAPAFLFAITMENHGPLHLETVSAADEEALYVTPPPRGFDELTVYLRHLANADRMLAALLDLASQTRRDCTVCFFGDHVPAMPEVYRRLAFSDARTDYLIWRRGSVMAQEWDIDVEALSACLLDASGFKAVASVP